MLKDIYKIDKTHKQNVKSFWFPRKRKASQPVTVWLYLAM